MATEENLDEIDIKILKLLQQNSRLTVKELAARVNLSPSPTFERQKRLEREGYIQRYGAIVDHHKMGHNVIVLCNIRLKQHTHDLIQQFMDIVQTIDQITECYNTTGDYDQGIRPGYESLSGLHAQHAGKYRMHRKPAQYHRDW